MTVVIATALLSTLLCGVYLRLARRWQLLDTPNERSSHSRPTPHGGGTALMLALVLGLVLAAWFEGAWNGDYLLLAAAGLLLMVLGVVDDLVDLSVRLRFGIYAVLCLLVCVLFLQPLFTANVLWDLLTIALAAFAMLWFINLYNFMDGIDGIAALQTVFICCSVSLLCAMSGGDSHYILFCLLLAAAHAGFLVWNWPPARLFMGDAGSIPTGFLLAALALLGTVQEQLSVLCWLVLSAVFITDATWTLLWRMATGQAFTRPHRLHAYQRLSRHWGSHLRVDVLLLAVNLLWLLPIAWLAQIWVDAAFFLVILAYLPLLAGMAKIGRFT